MVTVVVLVGTGHCEGSVCKPTAQEVEFDATTSDNVSAINPRQVSDAWTVIEVNRDVKCQYAGLLV